MLKLVRYYGLNVWLFVFFTLNDSEEEQFMIIALASTYPTKAEVFSVVPIETLKMFTIPAIVTFYNKPPTSLMRDTSTELHPVASIVTFKFSMRFLITDCDEKASIA